MKKKHLYTAVILLSFLAAGIQPAFAINIPDDESVGTWDEDNSIYTLTSSVTEGLVITQGNLTLIGGAGVTVTPGLDEGVDIDGKSGITVQNLNVIGAGAGISLRFSNNCNISNNTLDGCQYGIFLAGSDHNVVTGNTADQSSNQQSNAGIWLQDNASYNSITNNTTKNTENGYGIYAQDCTNNNDLANNTITNNEVGIGLFNCSNFSGSITGNTISSNIQTNDAYAIYLYNSDNNTLRNNTLSGNYRGLRILVGSDNNLIYNNNFINTVGLHASVTDSTGNMFSNGDSDQGGDGGNYWDDYVGTGVYNNGYGVLDEYPWAEQDGWVTNEPPVSDAGPDQTVECACQTLEGTQVTLDGTGSSDPDGDPLISYTWTGPFVGGTVSGATPTVRLSGCQPAYVISLVVNDGQVDSEPDTVTISVVDTTPPDVIPPGDVTIEAMGPDGVPVEDERIQTFLAGASATDNCDPDPTINNDAPSEFPPGDTLVTFTATDTSGYSSTCQSTVTVVEAAESSLRIIPSIINRDGILQNILAVIRFPVGTAAEDIDISQTLILYPGDSPIGIVAASQRVVTWYSCGVLRVSIFAGFSKDEVTAGVPENGPAELMVIGRFTSGQYFYGFDNVWICSWNW